MRALWVIGLVLAGCGEGLLDPNSGRIRSDNPATLSENWTQDILSTSLKVDLATHRATATVRLTPGDGGGASFEVQGLEDLEVSLASGEPVTQRLEGGRLDLLLEGTAPVELVFSYRFKERDALEGVYESGVTFTWPYYCGNLFPCKSQPADGLRFSLELDGAPAGATAVYPRRIDTDAPSYMLGWAVGDYEQQPLGQTRNGTRVSVWYFAGDDNRQSALAGTARLREVVDWLEQRVGPYAFGDEFGSVAARWPGAYGGMEHHPFVHVDSGTMSDDYIQAHETAHGWFGDGIRLRCWEDFVMSEGPTSYLAARAMVGVAPPEKQRETEQSIWTRFRYRLQGAVGGADERSAWPPSCGKLDVLKDNLFTSIPYMKGAFFLRAVERRVGTQVVDRALARFYKERVGAAAGMRDLIETIKSEAAASDGAAVEELANTWLRSTGLPDGYEELAAWSDLD